MRKIIILCFVLASTHSFSQSFTRSIFERLSFGVKAGANYSNFTNANFETEGLTGFHAGLLVDFKLGERFFIQEEFLFSSQGAKVKEGLFGEENIKLSYMTVPILLKFRSRSGIYFEAGPQVGALIKSNIDETQTDGKFANQLDFGVAGGLGFQTKNGFGMGARYVAGLSKVGDFKSSTINADFRNDMIQASVFYLF